jgi:hypothetical protein
MGNNQQQLGFIRWVWFVKLVTLPMAGCRPGGDHCILRVVLAHRSSTTQTRGPTADRFAEA